MNLFWFNIGVIFGFGFCIGILAVIVWLIKKSKELETE